ncbi:centromere protein F-like [Orbicella faveolata]|uniref:centromere protein F-like n=1 Tax=Orbicella faveolata TaxID=48498 RepID=UPI0009E2BED2|nr:centromere protein F-like [Orbicella faveolata]
MSWARDEWKLDLPTTALRKISELENDAENLRKSKQQQQLQLESVASTLQKQKQLNAEEKASNSNLRREIQELTRQCSDLESQEEKTQVDLKAKDNKIGLLEEQLRKAKAKLKDEEDKNSDLLSQIDQQKLIAEAKENEIGELSEELERTKDAKAQMVKDMEGR